MKQYLFDAFPLLCWLQEEPGWAMVDQLLTEAEEGKAHISVHIMNLGEVFYRLCRLTNPKRAEEILANIRMLPLSVISVSDSSVMEAAKIKGQYPISYADAFAVSAAMQMQAVLVTADPEYKSVSKMVEILWVK
ncbi:MAG: type II toxin-antitoxin system VapC family toxin [Deltaproteobacteria bacterium]|jgi:predicted nucleic acid-binding protein|nr:type II toxin-antitoxin system VapC family toxin [Deltaproteobacteria bacterium]